MIVVIRSQSFECLGETIYRRHALAYQGLARSDKKKNGGKKRLLPTEPPDYYSFF